MMDPHILAGLATLIVLELVLGIDNLVFVAILANKLPPHQRDKARNLGLALAMGMRIGMLSLASWFMKLTEPFVTVLGHSFSLRDLLLVGGGVFLLFKATREIHQHLEQPHQAKTDEGRRPSLAATLFTIVVLDAVFSLDAIITAVGMVEHLWVMVTAVVISMTIMIRASKPLTAFVSKHPTVIILCLSFLLLIGCSLIADGFGIHFPKAYLYAAIAFSLMIEGINQVGGLKRRKAMLSVPLRDRTADAILRLLGSQRGETAGENADEAAAVPIEAGGLRSDETRMIRGVISLGTLQIRSIMTLRPDIAWIDCNDTDQEIIAQLLGTKRTRMLLCDGTIDEPIGVIEVRDALVQALSKEATDLKALARKPVYVQRSLTVTGLIDYFRREDERFAVVLDEGGNLEGVVTTTDIFAAIAGDLADDEDDDLVVHAEEAHMRVRGLARITEVEAHFGQAVSDTDRDYETVSGHLLAIAGRIPDLGDSFDQDGLRFTIEQVDGRRIEMVDIVRIEEMAQ